MSEWKRPESVPYPSIWRTFQRTDDNGVEKTYWIQDVTEDYKEAFIQLMVNGFLRDENICKDSNFLQDPESIEQFVKAWNYLLKQQLGLICLTKNEKGEIVLVGGNATAKSSKENKISLSNYTGRAFLRLLSACQYVSHLKDIFTELNTDSYLTAGGLYILPQFRGQGIATEVLKARRDLCLTVGIDVSATVFTSATSQKCAARAGFQDFTKITYKELEKENPEEWSFPEAAKNTASLKFMYIDYRKIN